MVAVASLAVIVACMRFAPKVPGAIVVLFGATLVQTLRQLPVETIGTRFGGIPSGLPHIQFPIFRGSLIFTLLSSAITVAMLGAIESLLSAVVAGRMTNDRHNPTPSCSGRELPTSFLQCSAVYPPQAPWPRSSVVVAYNMGDWREIPGILKLGAADVAVWLVTFLLTVFADLTVGLSSG